MAGVTELQPFSQIWSAVCFYQVSLTTYSHAHLFGFVFDAFTVQWQSWTTARESTKTNIITVYRTHYKKTWGPLLYGSIRLVQK